MPTITFVTPPGRPSVLRANTVQEGEIRQDATEATTSDAKPSTSALRPIRSAPSPEKETQPEPVPLTFQKRILPQLTTSPEPVKESFDLPQSRISLDDARPHRPQLDDSKKPSLLSTAMITSSAQPPRSASTTNLGILRRAESENVQSSTEGMSRATIDATEGINPAPRPRLHFVEPHKETVSHVTARPETSVGPHNTNDSNAGTTAQPSASSASEHPTSVEPAPRKRSLVIQEHADVLERAAERAARQANNLSTQALEQHTRTGALGRSRQHSTSSAGDETASTRSSWALRSNSRGSSVGTSPTIVSDDSNAEEPPAFELSKHAEESSVVPIFNNTTVNDTADAPPQLPAAPTSSRRLTFIDPAPSRRRVPPKVWPISPSRRDSDREASSSSKKDVSAVSDGDGHTTGESSRRVLAFAACPKPERAARLSPAHATRKPKSKLSASPAPHKLAYPARLRGIRGSDPIRSPAPDRIAPLSTQLESWGEPDQDVSSEGSGYSEDEEDDDSEDDDDDDLGRSDDSDIQSLNESLSQQSEEGGSIEETAASPVPSMEVEELRESPSAASNATQGESEAQYSASGNVGAPQQGPSRVDARRRSSTPGLDQLAAANAALAAQRSPPRLSQPPRSQQTSPRSGAPNRSARKLKPKESFSHPMCFLPDAFEDSAPPTPTEPESDGYEPPRANLLHGWLSEGGSAASSRRASWQQQPSPGLRGSAPINQEGLAVPITLPPFRRTRERTAPHGVTSDGEQSSRSLGGNAAFIRESAGFGRSLNCNDESLAMRNAGASQPPPLGISVPADGRPSQPVMWRHLSTQYVSGTERPSTAVAGYRRASHSMEPRKVSSAFTSPIGSYSHLAGRITPLSHASSSERPVRPSVGKQRAVSTSSHIRSRPSVAPSLHDTVAGATSPPREDAFTHLKHQLAQSPRSHGEGQRGPSSGSTTPGWTSDGQLPSQTTSRYWTERLSSLAQAMSEELSMVGNAVLGYDTKTITALPNGEDAPREARGEPHRRSHSVPLQSVALPHEITTAMEEPLEPASAQSTHPTASATAPITALEPPASRRNSVGVPVPIRPKPIAALDAWSTERDGETHAPPGAANRRRRRGAQMTDESGSIDDDTATQPFQFAKKEVGEDGQTRLVVIHTSDRLAKGVNARDRNAV